MQSNTPSITTIPSLSGQGDITLPRAGDKREEGDKTYVWTIANDGTCSIGQWIEQKVVWTWDSLHSSGYCGWEVIWQDDTRAIFSEKPSILDLKDLCNIHGIIISMTQVSKEHMENFKGTHAVKFAPKSMGGAIASITINSSGPVSVAGGTGGAGGGNGGMLTPPADWSGINGFKI